MKTNQSHIPSLDINSFVRSISVSQPTEGQSQFFSSKLENIARLKAFINGPYIFDFYAIYFVTKGTMEKINQIRTITIDRNEIFFSKPGEIRTWNQLKDLQGHMVLFTEGFLSSVLDNKHLLNTFEYLASDLKRKYQLAEKNLRLYKLIMEELQNEFDNRALHNEEFIKFRILILLIKTNRMFQLQYGNPHGLNTTGTFEHIYKRFIQLLEKSYNQLSRYEAERPMKVKEYADMLNISASYFGECVRKASGRSAKSLIDEKTLLIAKCRLIHTSESISKIAYSLGFDTSGYFIRFFKKFENITPLEFRKSRQAIA